MHTRPIGDIRMAYVDRGRGMPVLFIHGFPFNSSMWSAQIRRVSSIYRAIAPDLRGHGQTTAPPGPYTMDQHAHDLCTLLDALRLTRVVLVGMSMGGYIAFAFYRAFPDRVRALVLADTRAEADTPEGRQAREDSARAAEAEGTAAQTEKLLPRLLSPFTLHHRPTIVARVQTMIAGTSPQGFAGAQRGMALRPDATPLLSTIACPTLILVGEDDVITPPAVAQTMHRRIAGSHLVIIPKAGHLAPMENPRAFNVALVEFLHAIRRGH